jgi:hypothetical protein
VNALATTEEGVSLEASGSWRQSPALPPIALCVGAGLLVASAANVFARATMFSSPLLAWAGVLLIALPIFLRLLSRQASAGERLALVCMLGLGLYCVKIFRDAPMFTFADELVHAYNVEQIGTHHHLFHSNPILEVTPYYPGLEGATAALKSISGVSTYVAGLIVVGAARLVLMVSLFVLFARVSGSARTAGLAAAIYTANFNFLFWSSQFSYESLSLPLLLMLMMAFAVRETEPRQALADWTLPIVLGIGAVIVTHHLTSYAMVAVLAGLAIAHWAMRRDWRPPNPWPFAVLAAALAVLWLVVVASSTVGYLSPVLGNAADAIVNTVQGEEAPRGLFQGRTGVADPTPLGARALGVIGVLLLVVGLPFGLHQLWRRFRGQPYAWLFGLAALAFFATLGLRLAPEAWETGNRANEFLFVGLAFVLALACRMALRNWSESIAVRGLLTAGFGVVLLGGAISGWPWDLQIAQPLRVEAESGEQIVSQPLALAEWARDEVPGGKFAATTADANLLMVPGGKDVVAGSYPDVQDILADPSLKPWELPLLRENDLRYVAADRRLAASDVMRGYYFASDGEDPNASAGGELLSKGVVSKFNRVPDSARIYTNGAITVYDLEAGR